MNFYDSLFASNLNGGGKGDKGAKTVNGNPLTITDAEGMSADNVVTKIEPVQTGSGVPSPDNIRPITGLSSVSVDVCGKNLCHISNPSFVANYSWCALDGSKASTYYNGTRLHLGAGTYYVKISDLTNVNTFSVLSASAQSYMSGVQGSFTLTSEEDVYIRVKPTTTGVSLSLKIMFELGDGYSEYEPYKSKQNEIQLGQTIYGGVLNVTSGELTITDINIASYNGEELPSTWISDRDEYTEGGTPTTGAQVVYKVATPTKVTITPKQIELFENDNTIKTNAKTMEITYQKNNSIGDTFKAIDNRVVRLEDQIPAAPSIDGSYKLTVTVASGVPTYEWVIAT